MTRRTEATNTTSAYGWVARAFHWSIAVLIVTVIVLGTLANDAGFETDAALARKAWLFSFHKTVGVTIFFVALARIVWALSQPRPRPLHGGMEGFLAAAVHWLLYGSLVIVPLLGWSSHATAEGFAPIWWPFGQGLPGLGKDAALSETLGVLHEVFVKLLIGALILHIAGTIKHVVIDKDRTFARMWNGADPGVLSAARAHVLPAVVAVGVWIAALGVGLMSAFNQVGSDPPTVPSASTTAASNWTVEGGLLSITVTQIGSPVTGSFADWQAAIDFDETTRDDGTNGTVEVSINTATLTLGSVTSQAISADFLATQEFSTATYTAVIRPDGDAYIADGTLDLRGAQVPLTLPFALTIEDDRATMVGQAQLDRRDFGMGVTYPDESNVGFGVVVNVELTAMRTP